MLFKYKSGSEKSNNLIEVKERELEGLVRKSCDAIDIVSSTINSLESVNSEIEGKISEIQEYQKRLELTKERLDQTQSKNSKIIGNFKKLLEV